MSVESSSPESVATYLFFMIICEGERVFLLKNDSVKRKKTLHEIFAYA